MKVKNWVACVVAVACTMAAPGVAVARTTSRPTGARVGVQEQWCLRSRRRARSPFS